MGRVHAHYQQQLEALNAQLLAQREQQRQQDSAPVQAQRRAPRAGGLEGTGSSAALVDSDSGTETTQPLPPPRFAPPRPPATAEEAAYLRKRLAEVQELFDVVRAATTTTAAEARTTTKGPGAGAGGEAAAGGRTVPLGFDPFDPTFGGACARRRCLALSCRLLVVCVIHTRIMYGRSPSISLRQQVWTSTKARSSSRSKRSSPSPTPPPAASPRPRPHGPPPPPAPQGIGPCAPPSPPPWQEKGQPPSCTRSARRTNAWSRRCTHRPRNATPSSPLPPVSRHDT